MAKALRFRRPTCCLCKLIKFKDVADQGKLIDFADNLFFIIKIQEKAETALTACDRIKIAGLKINQKIIRYYR